MLETDLFDFNPINHCCSNNRTISELKEFTTKHVCQALKSLVKVVFARIAHKYFPSGV